MLAAEIRDRLGTAPERSTWPLVSIVVINRDGAEHLRRLLAGLIERTDYPRVELILVDNGSSDESLEFIRSAEAPFPISILANAHNESFSDANNQGAELASGELLLFLNNDIEPFESDWLRELTACLRATRAGAVGATLIYPNAESGSPLGYGVQTQRAWLSGDGDHLAVEPSSCRRELFDGSFGEDIDSPSLIGACVLIDPEIFRQIGGFTHGFFYGGEDDDLVLKVRERGLSVFCSGRSFLIHHFNSTSRELPGGPNGPIRRANLRLLRRRWSARLWRECHLDRLAGGGLWAPPEQETPPALPSLEEVLALGFCLKADGLPADQRSSLEALETELGSRGHRCLVLRDDSIDDPQGFLFDVAVHLRGPSRYIPQPSQLNVLWLVSNHDAIGAIEYKRYDLVVTDSAEHAATLSTDSEPTPVIALDRDREAASLIDAVLERARETDFPTRIEQPHPLVGKTPQQVHEWFWQTLYKSGQWEPDTRALLHEILRPGDLFVDIGAWIGPVTLWALECGSRVIAVEPDPVALPELRRRVPDSVEIWEGAVAVHSGTAALTAPGKLGISGSRLAPEGEVEVRTWTLPEILAGRRPALVKIDIEGYEIKLLPTLAPYLADLGVPLQVALHGTPPDLDWFAGYREVKMPENLHHTLVARP